MPLERFAVVELEGLTGAVKGAAGAGVTAWCCAVHAFVDGSAGSVGDTCALVIVEVAAGEGSPIGTLTLGHALSCVASVFDDGGRANGADGSQAVTRDCALAGGSDFARWHTGVAVGVANQGAGAVTKSVTSGGLNALANTFVAVTSFEAHAVVGAGLRDAGTALVALKAHAAGINVSAWVTGPSTYTGATLLVAVASAWAAVVGGTSVIGALRNTARAVIALVVLRTISVVGAKSGFFTESLGIAEATRCAVIVGSAGPARLRLAVGIATPIIALVATRIVAVLVAVAVVFVLS